MERRVIAIRINPSLAISLEKLACEKGTKPCTLAREIFENALIGAANQKPA